MSRLLIMRHAAAQYANRQSGDRQRPLTDAGRLQAAEMARLLMETDEIPMKLVHSDAQRCVETAHAMLSVWNRQPKTTARGDMYLASAETLDSIAQEAFGDETIPADGSVLFLAHNPGVSEWVRYRGADDPEARTSSMSTADIAIFEFEDGFNPGTSWTRDAMRFVDFLRSHR